ncbi:amidohydrolase [Flavobacterium sp. TSSA_36]|uniref:amidohydrolase n=1 Tax=Flavobacterium sp. TSSA_36 TaxID=3447669 RepID=UPI003F2D42F9
MKIAIIQTALVWENPAANRNYFEEKIKAITEPIDLIVLPEMFTSGFTMHPNLVAEPMEGETMIWLLQLAKTKNAAITGSLVISDEGNFYNRLVFVFPSGEVQFYDKRHLFTLAGEDKVYTAGKSKTIIDYRGWKMCPLICYDLRFPAFSRNSEEYDVLLYVANWPNTRINAWDTLLKARAIENMCYTIGVNRIGVDANHHIYNGHSQVQDYLGRAIVEPQEADGVFIATLEKSTLLETRQKLGFLNDKDDFEIK